MRPADRAEMFRRLQQANPHPTTELSYTSPFELLVAVVLSAQATDMGVNKATARLYPVANTPEAILALGEEGLISYINTIGLYRSKAKHVIGLCQQLIEKHNGEVPHDRAALEALPGVGRKTGEASGFSGFARQLPKQQRHGRPALAGLRVDGVIAVAAAVTYPAQRAAVGHGYRHGQASGGHQMSEGRLGGDLLHRSQ